MINICHITPTPFLNESRVKKQVFSLSKLKEIDKIFVLALNKNNLPNFEFINKNGFLYRININSRFLPRTFFLQIIKYIEVTLKIIYFVRKKRQNIIIIHSLSLLPIGVILKLLFNIKLVYDCHELETERFGLKGIWKKISKKSESFFIRFVDLVIVVSEGIYDWYFKKYNLKNIIIIRNSPSKRFEGNSNYFKSKFDIPKKNKIILYLGGLFKGRSIDKILRIFDEINSDDLSLIFMGYGPMDRVINQYAQINKNIFLHNAVSSKEILEYASSADIGIAYLNNGSLNDELCLPNKFFEYIFSGLPVITSKSPDMVKILERYNIGISISELNRLNFLKSITKIKEFDKDRLRESLKIAADNLSWVKQERILLNGFRNLILNK